MKRIWLGFILSVAIALPASSATKQSYYEMWHALKVNPECGIERRASNSRGDPYYYLDCYGGWETWYATDAEHPVHPAIIKRTLKNGPHGVEMIYQTWTFEPEPDPDDLKRWENDIKALDTMALKEFGKTHKMTMKPH